MQGRWRRFIAGIGFPIFFVFVFCFQSLAAQAPLNKPIKLNVKPDREKPSYALGEKITIEVIVEDANHKAVKVAKDFIIELEVSGRQFRKKLLDTVKVGETSAKFQLQAEEVGVWEIKARHAAKNPELREGGIFIGVKPARPLLRSRPGAWMPGLNAGFAAVGRMAQIPTMPAVAASGAYLVFKGSPQRTLLADGKDAATIHVFFYSEDGIAPRDIKVRLFSSGGKLVPPQTLLIPQGEDYASATLTSQQVGEVRVEYLGSTPAYKADGDSTLKITFGSPVTQIEVKASPDSISLVDKADMIVRLLDEDGTPVVTEIDRQISFAIERGRGELETTELTIPAGRAENRTGFLPIWIGNVTVSAATPDLAVKEVALRVALPVLLLSLSGLGGLTGGAVAYWTKEKSKWWRLLIGLIAGFILYWAFVFGALNTISRAIVLNPLSAFALSTIGGWLGTEVFVLISKKLGLAA